jgi:hypothetical protein
MSQAHCTPLFTRVFLSFCAIRGSDLYASFHQHSETHDSVLVKSHIADCFSKTLGATLHLIIKIFTCVKTTQLASRNFQSEKMAENLPNMEHK